jgi:hypothetical protein
MNSSGVGVPSFYNVAVENYLSNHIAYNDARIKNEMKVHFYPNPFTEYINIGTSYDELEISILNAEGRVMHHFVTGEKTIHTSEWKPGLYIISVRKDESVVCTERLIRK